MEAPRGPREVPVMPPNTEQQSMMGNTAPTHRHNDTLLRYVRLYRRIVEHLTLIGR